MEAIKSEVFRRILVVLTIFPNAAEKFLMNRFSSTWIIKDEVGVIQDAQILILVAVNMRLLKRILEVGDVQRLLAVV